MRVLLILLSFLSILASCKNDKTSNKEAPIKVINQTGSDSRIQEIIDSIKSFKPVKLNINEDHSDMDHLIPLGINNHGSLAYIVDEDMGGASGIRMDVVPTYESYTIQVKFERDEEMDTILEKNKEFIYHALKTTNIRLQNSLSLISPDSLQKKYGIKFDVKKTFGPPEPESVSGRKTLTSAEISFRQGDGYPSGIVNVYHSPIYGIYDIYISDCIVVNGEEGPYGFAVVVTESNGFEGYIRKSIEVVSLGVINGE